MSVPSHHTPESDDVRSPVTILLIDDDEHWAWATSQLLEHEDEFTVETAHSLAAGRDRFDELDPDCVVCDYDLGDGDGLAFLDTVREVDPDRPFVLVTGKGDEVIASTAIERGVTDYIRKGRDDEDELLVSRIRNLVRAYRSEQALRRQRRTKTAVLDVLRETANETDLCREFCRQLVDTHSYALVWIGTTTQSTTPLPRGSAGRNGYLDALVDRGEVPADEPARVADHRNETVIEDLTSEDSSKEWRRLAADHGFQRVIAVPIESDGVSFGVLSVYLDRSAANTLEPSEVEEYAGSVGYALRSLDRKRSLLSAQPVQVDVTVSDSAAPLVALAERVASNVQITCPSVVTRNDGTTVYVVTVREANARAIESAVDDIVSLAVLDMDAEGERLKCTLAASETTPEGTLVEHNAHFDRTVVEDGIATISTHIREDRRVSQIATAVEQQFEGTSVSTVWAENHPQPSITDSFAELTDKQHDVLRHAFHEGYFKRPRGANASEISDRMGISRHTFAQHLRAAQRKIFGAWQTTGTNGNGE